MCVPPMWAGLHPSADAGSCMGCCTTEPGSVGRAARRARHWSCATTTGLHARAQTLSVAQHATTSRRQKRRRMHGQVPTDPPVLLLSLRLFNDAPAVLTAVGSKAVVRGREGIWAPTACRLPAAAAARVVPLRKLPRSVSSMCAPSPHSSTIRMASPKMLCVLVAAVGLLALAPGEARAVAGVLAGDLRKECRQHPSPLACRPHPPPALTSHPL